jgi:hypothetical protein
VTDRCANAATSPRNGTDAFFFSIRAHRIRFYDASSSSPTNETAILRPSMDMFSFGCVVAEVFLEGEALVRRRSFLLVVN